MANIHRILEKEMNKLQMEIIDDDWTIVTKDGSLAGLFEGLQRFDILKGVQVITTLLSALSIIILLMSFFSAKLIRSCK